ncbi:MAG: ribonuclease HII [Candidatus Wallbacteria bacterium]|nr:ribonuclease HII [Candidatus Wallbacteria bacterium]
MSTTCNILTGISQEEVNIDRRLRKSGIALICGIDEAGRGPLAGPVVAACVVLSGELQLSGIRDSKKLSDLKRRLLYPEIMAGADDFSFGIIGPDVIDQRNILTATKAAMMEALGKLKALPDYVLIDAVRLQDLMLPSESPFHGEDLSQAIAAASILAKVRRDDLMDELDQEYPQYGFRAHKGYGTLEHLINLSIYGPSPVHRKSFEPVKGGLERPEFYLLLKRLGGASSKEELEELVRETGEKGNRFGAKGRAALMRACKTAGKRLERNPLR